MHPEIARLVIRRLTNAEGRKLKEVKFFGGEPGLNLPAIEAAIEEIETVGNRLSKPKLGIVTNGTLVNDTFMDLCKSRDICVTVSLDGPPSVHDRLRCYPDGKGSYATVLKGIERLRSYLSPANLRFEATYTKVHQDQGLSRIDVAEHARDLGIPVGFVYDYVGTGRSLVCSKDEEGLKAWASYLLEGLLDPEPFTDFDVFRLISTLLTRTYCEYLCPIGQSVLCIAPTGDIYPCNLMIYPEFRMGSILDSEWASSPRFRSVQEKLEPVTNRERNPNCLECWCYPICGGCPARLYALTGRLSLPPQSDCDQKRALLEDSLRWLLQVSADSTKWHQLKTNLRHIAYPE
jgi:uncharacterized protein